jgi:hypothetical protein
MVKKNRLPIHSSSMTGGISEYDNCMNRAVFGIQLGFKI